MDGQEGVGGPPTHPHVWSHVGALEEVGVELGSGAVSRASEDHAFVHAERDTNGSTLGREIGSLVGPHGLTPNGCPTSTSCSRDRDYDDIDDDDPFNPQARRIAAHNPARGQLHSFCSYSSGLGSQCSLQPPTQTISNAPVSEYMYAQLGPLRLSHPGWAA